MDESHLARTHWDAVDDDDVRLRAYRRSALEHVVGWVAAGAIVAFVAVMLITLV
jgi:hypothetical protein